MFIGRMVVKICFTLSSLCGLFVILLFQSTKALELSADSTLYRCSSSTTALKNRTEPELAHTIENCKRKIRLSLNVKNVDKSPEEVKYIFVKDVVDVETGIKLRLLNPFVVRFRQEQVLLAYPMKYLTAVNARADEHVINYENRKNFTGCDDESPINPSCGIQHSKGIPVEYSQGFCCFCPTTPTTGKQARGGQDCSLTNPPSPEIDLTAYKASAHCLKKSSIWYTVNALDEPGIMHQTFLQVYNERHLRNGSSVWYALTGEEDYNLGSLNPYQYDDNKTIVITYITEKPLEAAITVPYQQNRILVPQPMIGVDVKDVPDAVKKGATDYLIISKDVINSDGADCDKAGVSYEGFSLQSDRCDVPRNTCLKNQPLDFWESDVAKGESGKKGSHLLKNFGVPYKDPIFIDKETKEHWLVLEYYKPHRTSLYIETKADNIIALKVGKYALILYVITESTSKGINFYASIQNSGLVSSEYTVQALHCAYSVADTNAQVEIIPPQLKVDFVVSTKPGTIQLSEKFTCTVEVKSAAYGVIAKREVTIKPKTRCICNLHCLCVCLGESLKCEPMTETDFHFAGFRGSLPILTAKPPHKPWVVKYPLAALFAFVLILLLIGFIKGSFGLVGVDFVAELGLYSHLYKPGKLDRYTAPEFESVDVIYDDEGYPINPNTENRYKTYTMKHMFLLNFFFFFFWPCDQCLKQLGKKHKHPGYEDISTEDTVNEESIMAHRASAASELDQGLIKKTSSSLIEEPNMPSGSAAIIQMSEPEEYENIDPDSPEYFKGAVKRLNRII